MKISGLAVLAMIAGLVLVPGQLLAHHSEGEFDHTTLTTFQATVTQYEFVNPHILIHFDAPDSKGNVENWTLYGNPPARAKRDGWNSQTFKSGEQLTINGFKSRYPARNIILFGGIIRANGEVVKGSGEDRAKRWQETYPDKKPVKN